MAVSRFLLVWALAYKRRYIDKLEKLSATKPNQEKTMYAFLVALVLLGYLIEGVRILGTGCLSEKKPGHQLDLRWQQFLKALI